MSSQQPDKLQTLHEELSAYLDGELSAEARRQVEQRLSREPAYRSELQQLQRAWELLDKLPHATVDESFSRTTLEMVTVAASQEAAAMQQQAPWWRRRPRLFAGGGLIAIFLIGFLVGRWCWPSPNQALLRDLPVLENLDAYRQTGDIDFLRSLHREGLFDEDGERDG